MKTPKKLFLTNTTLTLWRLGNSSSSRMSHLRLPPRPAGKEPDIIPISEFVNGELVQFVLPHSGGVSLYDAIHPGLNGDTWYELPAGTEVPAGLAIQEDEKDPLYDVVHYTAMPAYKMTLEAYVQLLDLFGKKAEARFEKKFMKG